MDDTSANPPPPDSPFTLTLDNILSMNEVQSAELLKQIETDPALKLQFIKALNGKDVLELKRRDAKRNQPYYNERYGKEAQKAMDYMMANDKSIEFPFHLKPTLSPRTFQQRMMQACAFACEQLDPTGKYKKFRNRFTINAGSSSIQFVLLKDDESPLEFKDIPTQTSFDEVMDVVNRFCAEGKLGMKVVIPQPDSPPIDLTAEQILEIESTCAKFEHTNAMVTSNKITLYKFKEGA